MTESHPLPPTSPEKQGVTSQAILEFVDEIEKHIQELHSFILVRHGHRIAQGWWSPYAPDRLHMLFSLSKSFTSTAVGLAVAEGRLSVDDKVLKFFPEDAPAKPGKNLAAMRVRHLLSMSTGHDKDTMGRIEKSHGANWVKAFLSLDVEHEPGSYFLYNTGASYMLSAIVQKVTGQKLIDYLEPRLFQPLGIQGATWETSPQGINMGGFGLSIKTEDIARFGQLYLQKGMWEGQCILTEAWVKEASSYLVDNSNTQTNPDWTQGYGYQFWRCRHNAYRGDGAFGQYCIVMPEQDAVLAITSAVGDMQAVLNVIWDKLLPALGPKPLPENPTVTQALSQRLASLAVQPPAGRKSSRLAAKVSGKSYVMDANPLTTQAVTFEFGGRADVIRIRDARGEHCITCGKGAWLEDKTTLFERGLLPVTCSAVWKAKDTYQITIRPYETPFINTMTCVFNNGNVTITSAINVTLSPTPPAVLNGHTGE